MRPIATFFALFLLAGTLHAADVQSAELAAGTTDSALVAASAEGSRLQLVFCGFSARETGGASGGTVEIYNGTDATGELLFTLSLLANESRSEGPLEASQCLPAPAGIFVDRGGTGTTLLIVYSRRTFPQ